MSPINMRLGEDLGRPVCITHLTAAPHILDINRHDEGPCIWRDDDTARLGVRAYHAGMASPWSPISKYLATKTEEN